MGAAEFLPAACPVLRSSAMDPALERTSCPACGGAGGGPFGRAGSAWDDDAYVCVRCKGAGFVEAGETTPSVRPGLVKAAKPAAAAAANGKKRKATA